MNVEEDIRKVLVRTLKNARRQSVRHAYMEKLKTRLDENTAKRFDKLYCLRSNFLHEGKERGDLREPANEARAIAVLLLEAELISAMQFPSKE